VRRKKKTNGRGSIGITEEGKRRPYPHLYRPGRGFAAPETKIRRIGRKYGKISTENQ